MINTVYNILKPLNIPVQFMIRPTINSANKIAICYHFFGEGWSLHGDGQGKEFSGSVQIDIFSIVDYSNIAKQVIQLMEENGFRLADSRDSEDSLDNNTKYYQKILIFNYIESEVKRNGL